MWTLIIIVSVLIDNSLNLMPGGTAIEKINFETKTKCDVAQEAVNSKSTDYIRIKSICVEGALNDQ